MESVKKKRENFHSYLSVTVGCQNIRNIFWKATSDQNAHTTMESQEQDYSFPCCESDLSHLESVVKAYFNPRPRRRCPTEGSRGRKNCFVL